MTTKLLELASTCCGTCTCSASLKIAAKQAHDEIEALKLQVAMLKRNIAKIDKIDRFGIVEHVAWPEERADIIGQNGNDGEHYE